MISSHRTYALLGRPRGRHNEVSRKRELTPSAADVEITKRVIDAGRALGVAVHDHLVVGRDGVASFKTLGLL